MTYDILNLRAAMERDGRALARSPERSDVDPCAHFRPGEVRGLLEPDELQRFANQTEREAFRPDGVDLRYSPCEVVHRPRHLDRSRIVLPPAVLMRAELTNETMWPWCTIGRVFVGRSPDFTNWTGAGSGVMIGPNLLLTASHVAPWGLDQWWMRFEPAYRNGIAPFGTSYVSEYRGVRNTEHVTGTDYVVCRLYDRLGEKTGWMGYYGTTDDDFYYDGTWTSVGYPGDSFGGQVPMVEAGIRLDDVDDDDDGKELESYVYATDGWSGGPLWGWVNDDARVVGVLSGKEEEFTFEFWNGFSDTHTVSAGGLRMAKLISWARANWG